MFHENSFCLPKISEKVFIFLQDVLKILYKFAESFVKIYKKYLTVVFQVPRNFQKISWKFSQFFLKFLHNFYKIFSSFSKIFSYVFRNTFISHENSFWLTKISVKVFLFFFLNTCQKFSTNLLNVSLKFT